MERELEALKRAAGVRPMGYARMVGRDEEGGDEMRRWLFSYLYKYGIIREERLPVSLYEGVTPRACIIKATRVIMTKE